MTTKPPSIARALAAALRDARPRPEDAAAVALAKHYAALIDEEPAALVKVGPLLLAALTALSLTPAARRAVVSGGEPPHGANVVTRLRALRDGR